MEPVLVLEDYIDLLRRTSGRVIMLSACIYNECLSEYNINISIRYSHHVADACSAQTLMDGVQQRISQNLSFIMDPLGIRVCSVAVGPLDPDQVDTKHPQIQD